MIKPFLQNEQVCRLNSIIDEANKTFLKESRLSNNINFNILRVLSAFRLMYPESPQSLYNAIIYITKNYNPTSFNQWKAAINDLSKLKRNVQKQKNNFSRPQIASYMKTYQNSFNKSRMQDGHFQSKSFAQIKIPADLSMSDESSSSFCDNENKDISLTNAETGKRHYYTKTDTTQFPEKNHYISFQPYHYISGIYPYSYNEKENVNSTNIGESRKKDTSYQYIEAIRRDLAKTNKNSYVKSPIDQSFIKNIDSYESPYLLSQPDFLPLDPDEQKMNERAYGFLRFNLLFKSFSSLLANTLVLQKAKQHKLKAETQNRSNILQKNFEALKDNVEKQKIERGKQRKATMHFSKYMKSKVVSVFKLIFDLRNKQNPFDIYRLNTFSFEFVLALLLSTQKIDQSSKFNLIDFNLKIEQLISSNQIDKVCLIVKYFGNHSCISQQNFQSLVAKYRLSICKLVFRSIKSQQLHNAKFYIFRNQKLCKKAFGVLRNRWFKVKSNNIKVIETKGKRNLDLQQKVMKALLQMVYSRKIYSKRFDFLQKKTEMGVRMKLMGCWLRKAKQRGQRKSILKENIRISQLPLNRFYEKYAFRMIQQDVIKLLDNLNQLQLVIRASKSKKMIKQLKNGFENSKFDDFLEKLTKHMLYKLALSKWKSKTRKGKGITIVFSVLKKYCFRNLMSPAFEQCIEKMNEIKTRQMNSNKLFFRQWKNWCNDQLNKYQMFSQDFCLKMNFIRKIRVMKLLQENHIYEQQFIRKQQIRTKSQNLMCFIESGSKKYTLFTLISQTRADQITKRHKRELKKMIYYQKKIILFLNISEERNNNLKIKKLNQSIWNKCKHSIMDAINISLLNLKKKKLLHMIKSKSLTKVGDMAITYQKQNSKKEKKAHHHNNKKYLKKTIIGLYQLIKQRDQLQALAQQAKEIQYVQILRDGISVLRRQNKVKKISNSLDKKLLVALLKDNKSYFNKYRQLCLRNREATCKQVFLKLKRQNSSQNTYKQLQQKTQILRKWMFINKIQCYYSRSLVFKKYLFMAAKYRAIKICFTAFNIWKKRRFPPVVKQNERGEKGKERLSTDVMD